MSDTPRTDVAEHNMGSVVEPHYVVDADFSRYLERELAEVKEHLRLCNVDQFTTAAELAEAKAQRDLAVEALEIIKECFTTEAMFSETATAAMTASMIEKVLKECGE